MTKSEDNDDRASSEDQAAESKNGNEENKIKDQTERVEQSDTEDNKTITLDTPHPEKERDTSNDTVKFTKEDSVETTASGTESHTPDETAVKTESEDDLIQSDKTNTKNLLIYSGESGGKSTVIGGTLQHLYQKDDYIVTYEVEFGEVSQFEEQLIRPLMDGGKYPPDTESAYVARFDLSFDSRNREDAGIRFVDFPGSWLKKSADFLPSSNTEETTIRSKFKENDKVSSNEINTFLRQYYTSADRVILLLNLEQIINDGKSFGYDLELVRKITQEIECAVVVTGVDVIDYDPSNEEQTSSKALRMIMNELGIGGNEFIDEELLELMIQDIPQGSNPQLHNILRGIKSGCGADFFGVTVPSDADGKIVENANGFETRGFDQIIDWVLSR